MDTEKGIGPSPGSNGDLGRLIPGQLAFPREVELPPKPSEQTCDWCEQTAVVCEEIKTKVSKGILATGQYMCACPDHRDTLRRMIAAKASDKRRF